MPNQKKISIKNKKALSEVIATVLIILLVVVSTTLVWAFVNNMLKKRMHQVDSCFDAESSDKVSLNSYYTCFNPTAGEVHFSISLEDIEVDEILISISAEGSSKSIVLTNEDKVIENLRYYKGSSGESVKLPGENEGLTYILGGFTGIKEIDWVKISPVINEEQCKVTSTINEVVDCSILAN